MSLADFSVRATVNMNKRPQWLDKMRRPILIVCLHEKAAEHFRRVWRFSDQEVIRVRDFWDMVGRRPDRPLLIVGFDDFTRHEWQYTFREWEARGGRCIDIPEGNLHGQAFTDSFNLVADSICELCKMKATW